MTSAARLPFPLTITQLYSQAFWNPKPTRTAKSQRQLAYALGYPSDWRVERTVTVEKGKPIIKDRIHATHGKKHKSKYTWFHHEAAQAAAAQLEAEGTMSESHLAPSMPLYSKGDIIQVRWEDKWYEATITKRKKQADLFFYSVYYHEDDATQDEIAETDIRPGEDPSELAVELGFAKDWKASRKGSRYILTAPTGERFTTKKAAMQFIEKQKGAAKKVVEDSDDDDIGDPPWRKYGHEWIGRRIIWTSFHKASGTRKVKIDQTGIIEGFIKDTDVDKEGNPGFISEATGQPANLFHVVFPDEPHHPYASHLLNSQDLEESEVAGNLLEETAAAKRKREAAQVAAAEGEQNKVTPQKGTKSTAKGKKSTPARKRRRRS